MRRPMATAENTDALDHIADNLTQPQRVLLVGSLVNGREDDDLILVDGNEKTIKALMGQAVPLIAQVDRRRFLTPLGMDVARRLNVTGNWEVPKITAPFEIEL